MIHGWIWLFFAFSASGFAGERLYAKKFMEFAPPVTQACSLKSFSISTYDQGFDSVGGERAESSRGSIVGTVVETTEASCVRDFTVVQFIRGCVYDIEQDARTGRLERSFDTAISDPNGIGIPFKFDHWRVDTLDPDPMYESAPALTKTDSKRFSGLLYAKVPLRLDGTDEGLRADRETMFNSKYRALVGGLPQIPRQIFSVDVPVTASWFVDQEGRNSVTNVSLEFKVCLYKTKDVPLKGSPKPFSAPASEGGPLHCFDWESRNKFDFVTKKFISKKKLDPVCFESNPV